MIDPEFRLQQTRGAAQRSLQRHPRVFRTRFPACLRLHVNVSHERSLTGGYLPQVQAVHAHDPGHLRFERVRNFTRVRSRRRRLHQHPQHPYRERVHRENDDARETQGAHRVNDREVAVPAAAAPDDGAADADQDRAEEIAEDVQEHRSSAQFAGSVRVAVTAARIPAAGLAVEHPEEHDVDDQAAARGENHRRTIHLGWRTHSFNRLDHDYERRAPNHRDDPQRSEDFEPREAERQPAGVVIAARHSSLGRRTRRFESPVSSLLPERQFQDADGEGVGHKVRRHVQRVGEQRGGSGDGCKQNTTSF